MKASVTYRKKGDRWHIRFRTKGKKEITKTYPGSLQERTISQKCEWFKEQIALDREDPWAERQRADNNKRLSIPLDKAITLYITEGVETGRWKVNHKGVSRTADTNEQRLNYLKDETGNISVADLDKETVLSYLNSYGGNAYSKKAVLSTINTFLKWLYTENHKEQLVKVALPKTTKDQAKEIEKQVRGVTLYELGRLCVGLKIRDKEILENKYAAHYKSRQWAVLAFQFVFSLMVRRDEIDKIYPGDVRHDLSEITFGNLKQPYRPEFIPKGGIATIPTTSLARRVLKKMNVHGMPKDQPIIKKTPTHVYRKLVESAGIVLPGKRVRLHDLRHGGIMHYRSKGWPGSLVSQLARHSSSEVTEKIYGGIDPVQLKRTLNNFDQ